MVIFPLTVYKTYYETGFFNIKVAYDRSVRHAEGPINIILGPQKQRIDGRIDRSANNNKTARIMGGIKLRDWFHSNCRVGDTVFVNLSSMREIRITKDEPIQVD